MEQHPDNVRERSLRIPKLVETMEAEDVASFTAEMRSLLDPECTSNMSGEEVLQIVDRIDTAVRAWELSVIIGPLVAQRIIRPNK